ncbi:MAG TPA: beta-N-acetylglucosaminidase domain-containing protein [Jatrophihabitantaceae bacterium]|jgi:hyaluronoglucosaminidase
MDVTPVEKPMPRRHLVLSVVATLALSLLVVAAPAQAAPAPKAALPPVYPVPQSIQAHGSAVNLGNAVALVAGGDADAVRVVRAVLDSAGVTRVDEVSDANTARKGEPVIYVGNGSAALAALGTADASGLAAEGYVLATGTVAGHPSVVLDGHDVTGTFYAAQTLRQLVQGKKVPGVEVRDWPTMPLRGVIEGFYGTPWSHAARLDQLDFYGAHKMNTYVYSPKDDPYLRAQWRDPYPADQLAQLKELVDRAIANHVEFTYALSPGLSVCYSSAVDEQALVAKFQSLWDIGVRTFAIPLDDISYTTWNCDADATKFGTGGAAAGAAQSYLLNAVQRDFIATHPGASRLEMVPTEYYDVAASPYKNAIKAQLDPAVIVEWTGVGVIAPVITQPQAAAAKNVFGHDILVWDNYPVNDYVTNRLLLGPYVGRASGLSSSLTGITANPMIQPDASKIALFNVADYTWNDAAYDPSTSWTASLDEFAGGNADARDALGAFADLEYYSDIDKVQAPTLAGKTAAFWSAWERGSSAGVAALDAYLKVIQWIPSTLTSYLGDPAFVAETQPWLDSASFWGQAARAALRMLTEQRDGDGAAALADRARVRTLMVKAKSYQYVGLNGTVNVTVGDGVIDAFITNALAENDRWIGVAGRHVTAMTSMSTYQTNTIDKMTDGDDSTFYWSSSAPAVGDYVGVDLGSVAPISSVQIDMSKPTSPDDYVHVGVLEYSVDGTTWKPAGTFLNTPSVSATLPPGTQARYVRLRNTAGQDNWVVVREFTVTGPDSAELTVSGAPAAASGSSLAAAADGNTDTSYRASAGPAAGDALVVTLPASRPLGRVVIAGTGTGQVQVGDGTSWKPIGKLQPGYTDLGAGGRTASAIRLVWQEGSPAPVISEVVPWYADAPAADLHLTAASADVTVGDSVQVGVGLTSTQPADLPGTLTVTAPAGVTATPASTHITLLRGAQPSIPIALRGTTPGSYQVQVSFAGQSQTLTLNVHPQVSTTNVALAGTATASSVEQDLPQFTAPHANDGSLSTRWSSGYTDSEWLQIKLGAPQHLGKIVITWEAAHAAAYRIETSTDGTTWTDAADVTGSPGGTETVWVDQPGVNYLRMQGVARSSQYGYSIIELAAYPVV